ncbi:hypothetical protein B0O99DRAFT_70659 [Bisporella sp. PMI_857]|nr:hypothetical protein B0O99DRAFT_70659 [Bisporella sp. PMI_857]
MNLRLVHRTASSPKVTTPVLEPWMSRRFCISALCHFIYGSYTIHLKRIQQSPSRLTTPQSTTSPISQNHSRSRSGHRLQHILWHKSCLPLSRLVPWSPSPPQKVATTTKTALTCFPDCRRKSCLFFSVSHTSRFWHPYIVNDGIYPRAVLPRLGIQAQ